MRLTASDAVGEVRAVAAGSESIATGSGAALVFANRGHETDTYGDIDVFAYHPIGMAALIERMLNRGAVMDEQATRTWERWQGQGFNDWHTNSIRLELISGVEVNVVHKIVGRRALDSPEAVLGSFDFGYVAVGWDMRTGRPFDGRKFWLSHQPVDQLGFLPHREQAWLQGRVGRFMGIRQPKRWATMASRGWDMHPSQAPLVQGLRITAAHYFGKDDPEYRVYAPLYLALSDLVEMYAFEDILEAYKAVVPHDPVGSLTKELGL